MKENRSGPRLQVHNMSVDIFDGYGFFSGSICDISHSGLCLKYISKNLDNDITWLTIVATRNEANFRMTVRPCWINYDGYTKDIGVRIIEPPTEWKHFVERSM